MCVLFVVVVGRSSEKSRLRPLDNSSQRSTPNLNLLLAIIVLLFGKLSLAIIGDKV